MLLIGLHTVRNLAEQHPHHVSLACSPSRTTSSYASASCENVEWGKRGQICRYPLRCAKHAEIKPTQSRYEEHEEKDFNYNHPKNAAAWI
jgi:hypothetical protein